MYLYMKYIGYDYMGNARTMPGHFNFNKSIIYICTYVDMSLFSLPMNKHGKITSKDLLGTIPMISSVGYMT